MSWNKNAGTQFLGRNGYGICVDVIAEAWPPVGNEVPFLRITPITSKGLEARCHIEIPLGEVAALQATIQQAVSKYESKFVNI